MGERSETDRARTHLLVVRHAEAVVDSDRPPATWRLSPAGMATASSLAARFASPDVSLVASSGERKAIETAAIVAGDREVTVDGHLGEVKRPWTVGVDRFRAQVFSWLGGAEHRGWERHAAVVSRMDTTIRRLVDGVTGTVVVVSHGTASAAWLGETIGIDPVGHWAGAGPGHVTELAVGGDSVIRSVMPEGQ